MLSWFLPQCPLDSGAKLWTEDRLGWLLGQFGQEQLLRSRFVVPTREFFREHYEGTESAARGLFHRTCELMEIDPTRLELDFYRPIHRPGFTRNVERSRLHWAGQFELGEQKNVVRVDISLLPQAETLLATFAHELAHHRLLGSGRICEDDPDHELVTDLTTVFFGFGVFNANDSLVNHYRLNQRGEEIGRLGYLTPTTWGYALALCAWLRREEKPVWATWLRPEVQRVFRRSLQYLRKEKVRILTGGELDVNSRSSLLKVEYPFLDQKDKEHHAESKDPDKNQTDSELSGLELQSETTINEVDSVELLVVAMQFLEAAKWEQAHECLNEVIRIEPNNGTAYQQRAWVMLELGRFAEALQDAEFAVHEEPDDPESYRARGAACIKLAQFQQAVADLTQYVRTVDKYTARGELASRGYYMRGLAYAGQGKSQDAIADYDRAIQKWPDWPEPYEARAESYESIGKLERAAADREEARRRVAP